MERKREKSRITLHTSQNKGITLVALIITIIVLLILAVVAIRAVTGDGIIAHAKNAQTGYEEAQAKEEKMLEYYTGVIETQEIVPTVEQLQEKYTFSYYSSLMKAITDINNGTVANADVNAENAIAGIYEDDGNKYVVLMKDTEESNTISINNNMLLNLGGNTLSFVSNDAYLNFVENTVATIDGRIGGSSIEKNVSTNNMGLIYAGQNTDLEINSGKYSMNGEFTQGAKMIKIGEYTYSESIELKEVNKKFKIRNANLILNNTANLSEKANMGICITSESSIIENCKINANALMGGAQGLRIMKGQSIVSNSSIYANAIERNSYGILNYSDLTVNNTNISSDANNGNAHGILNNSDLTVNNTNISSDANIGKGYYSIGIHSKETLKFYSGNITGVHNALYLEGENKNNYIYGGTFSGYLWGGINIKTSNGKTYIENTLIQNGEYNGKYDMENQEGDSDLVLGGSSYSFNNELYVDNCTIIGYKNAISVGDAIGAGTGNILKISNSRVTGTILVRAAQKLYLGMGMDSVTYDQITANGTVERTNISYKGMDKEMIK